MFVHQVCNNFINYSALKNHGRDNQFSLKQTNPFVTNSVSASFQYVPSFGSNTSAGAPLKKLIDAICAYFGVKLIPGSVMTRIERQIDNAKNITETVAILSKYKDNMLKVERKMFNKFERYAKKHPDKSFEDCLKEMANKSLVKLKIEELYVLDDIDMLARKLSPKTSLAVRKKTTKCRQIIIDNDINNTFKRKTLLNSLDEIKYLKNEESLMQEIKDTAIYLPTSSMSENAFVIKYMNRSQNEIAKRLLRASVATVEHIDPDSLGGLNELKNFILACSAANSMRSNMPLPKFIKLFPDIPKNCQKFINDIISRLNKGKLKGMETYPYDVKKTLQQESENMIDLDLSKYKYTEEEAELIKKRYRKKFKNIK